MIKKAMEDNRFKNSNFGAVFGAPVDVQRAGRGCGETFAAPGALLFLVGFGALVYVSSNDPWTIPLCVGPPLLMFGLVLRQMFASRHDELRIYQNGFTYKSGRNLQTCLWKEIRNYRHRERNHREITALENGVVPLGAVEKKNGEVIEFDSDLPGTTEIIARFEARGRRGKS